MSREQWRELAREVLRRSGVDAVSPEEAMATATYDGITLAPLYDAADLPAGPGMPPSAGREPGRPWEVRQRHETADPEAVMTDLENGADSLWLAVAPEDLPRVLDGVLLDLISIVLDAGPRTGQAAEALLALAGDRAGALRGCLGADPLGHVRDPGVGEPALGDELGGGHEHLVAAYVGHHLALLLRPRHSPSPVSPASCGAVARS